MTDTADPGLDLPADSVTVEVSVGGKPYDLFAAPVCEHRRFHQQVTVALLTDDDGAVVDRQAQVRLLCAECGLPVRFRAADDGRVAALSPDGLTLSAVLDL